MDNTGTKFPEGGTQPPEGGKGSVWAKRLRWTVDAAQLVGSIFQVIYYGLEIW
ncbi:hypothetical protein ACFXAZ_34510 [Streptomyces sp. NPDC059477]|uniref:hypothetical protein n=1 Tax=Streptomyces sp. NPDC059477 TaxID=3346847 RepID=UPI0036CFD564